MVNINRRFRGTCAFIITVNGGTVYFWTVDMYLLKYRSAHQRRSSSYSVKSHKAIVFAPRHLNWYQTWYFAPARLRTCGQLNDQTRHLQFFQSSYIPQWLHVRWFKCLILNWCVIGETTLDIVCLSSLLRQLDVIQPVGPVPGQLWKDSAYSVQVAV
jgi:hypothetical protein